jgi:hypothetical protein
MVRAWEFFQSKGIVDLRTDVNALETFSKYTNSSYDNYLGWTEDGIRVHLDDISGSNTVKSKFDNDPELVEEWETLQLDEVSVATEDLLPADRYWQRANDLDVELGRKIEVNETGGFSNTPNIQGYGVLRFEDFSPSPNTAFSGVFDVDAGRFMVYPSGSTRYANGGQIPNGSIVPRRGGHRSIRNKMMDYYDDLAEETIHQRVVGFTMKYDSPGQLKVEFFSRSCNGPFNRNRTGDLNLRDYFVPDDLRPQIIDALDAEFNTARGYNFDITPVSD